MSKANLKIGLIINPIAGIGGSVALKGSDGVDIQQQAFKLGAQAKSQQRTKVALAEICSLKDQFDIYTVNDAMGENVVRELGFNYQLSYQIQGETSSAADTELAVKQFAKAKVDLILFAGGDGTARNICNVIDEKIPVLGIPAGCKIHSGVYALSPKSAGMLLKKFISGQALTLASNDVVDIDESLFRQGKVRAKRYGEMSVPMDLRYLQAVKMGSVECEELVIADIAADIIENMEDELYLFGSGSTTAGVMSELGLNNTLLGIDAVHEHQLIASDLNEKQIITLLKHYKKVKLIITLIGGQGHLFGRGNQQLSPTVINMIGRDNFIVIATKTKLEKLNGRPIVADTGKPTLDSELSGPIKVLTGYHDLTLYPIVDIDQLD